jgi:hypothetical protein
LIAFAGRAESVGWATFAGTTVVSTLIFDVRSTFTSTALANRASFSPSTAADPQRVVNFISVVAAPAGRSRSGRTAAR